MQCAIERGAKGTGAYPGRAHHRGLLKAAAEGAAGEAEVLEGLRCELGHCDPPAGVAGAGGSSAFSIGSASRMQMGRNWQQRRAGGKAKKYIRPELRAGGQVTGTVPEGQAAPAAPHCFMRSAVTWHRPAPRSRPVPAPRPGCGGTEMGLRRSPCSFLHTSHKHGWQRVPAPQQTLNPCANLPGDMEKQTRGSPERAVVVVVKATSE